jgi:PhzF family phenazine biosynthesis protein
MDIHRLEFRQIDVFTAEPFLGNPVAVVLGADGLDAAQMQRIATWTNLSETTFMLRPTTADADYRLRIFDPHAELPFAGHPTLGSARAFLDAGGRGHQPGMLIQECARGLIAVRVDADVPGRQHLRLPDAHLRDVGEDMLRLLPHAIGATPLPHPVVIDVGPQWLVARLDSAATVRGLTPDLPHIAALSRALEITGVTVFGSDGEQTEIRSFAPAHGIAEDPVCGSGNGAVAVYRRREGHRTDYVADQGGCLGRAGHVHVTYGSDDAIWIGGDTCVCISGTLAGT